MDMIDFITEYVEEPDEVDWSVLEAEVYEEGKRQGIKKKQTVKDIITDNRDFIRLYSLNYSSLKDLLKFT